MSMLPVSCIAAGQPFPDGKSLVVILLLQSATDDEIVNQIRSASKSKHVGFCVSEWDNDPREVWEIPEALALLDRFVRLGGFPILTAEYKESLAALVNGGRYCDLATIERMECWTEEQRARLNPITEPHSTLRS
ncbi:MAG: hypothetical protein JWN86_1751 [Planctomycetota bacterium]|nr:hypothetical protein [Planctomycetota bacterium]